MLYQLSYVDESMAGLEPATLSTHREECLVYGTCFYNRAATGCEGSELNQQTGDWNRASDYRYWKPTF